MLWDQTSNLSFSLVLVCGETTEHFHFALTAMFESVHVLAKTDCFCYDL
jgi:hypothetical protein